MGVGEPVSVDAVMGSENSGGIESAPAVRADGNQPIPRDARLANDLLESLFPESDGRRAVAAEQLARLTELWDRGDLAEEIRLTGESPRNTPDPVDAYISEGATPAVASSRADEAVDDGHSSRDALTSGSTMDGQAGCPVEQRGWYERHDGGAWPRADRQAAHPDEPDPPFSS